MSALDGAEKVVLFVKSQGMIKRGEKVLVAISGGIDSAFTAHSLAKAFEIGLFHIDLGIEGFSEESRKAVEKLAEDLGAPLFIYDLKKEWGLSLPEIAEKLGQSTCSVCGTIKRYYLLYAAAKYGYKVIATGHNLDDIVSFLIYSAGTGQRAALSPITETALGIRKIKPLYYFTEEKIEKYAKNLPYTKASCPFGENAPTKILRRCLKDIETVRPGFRKTLLNFFIGKMDRVKTMPNKCKYCGMPSSGSVCSVCRMRIKLGLPPEKPYNNK